MTFELVSSALFLITVGAVTAQTDQLNNPNCRHLYFQSVDKAITALDNCTFPWYLINASCVAESFPALVNRSLCPLNDDGSMSYTKALKIIQIVTDGLKQQKVCGIPINPDLIPVLTVIIAQILNGTDFNGTCRVDNNTATITSINSTDIELLQQILNSKSVSYDIKSDPDYEGFLSCNFTTNLMKNTSTKLNVINVNIPIQVNFSFSAVNVSSSAQIPENSFNSSVTVTPHLGSNSANALQIVLAPLLLVFKTLLKSVIQNSTWSDDFATFISAIANSAIQVAKEQCVEN
ncbi:hypothetical protein CHUAL_006511 [Chamberlinius hualienensis]